jgi:hypothetical protein
MSPEKENTFRTLRDEPLLATKQWWCRFGIHKWQIWAQPVKTRRGAYDYLEQYRRCNCCGKADRRLLARD